MRKKVNYAFYVSGKATRFKKFYEQCSPQQRESIQVVFSDDEQNSYLADILRDNNVKYFFHDFHCVAKDKNLALSDALLNQLIEHKVDYCFSFGDHILKGDILKRYQNRLINFHPALLPMYPGRKAIDKAIEEQKVFLLGNTAHFIDEGMDTGPIIMQSVMTVGRFYEGSYDGVLDVQVEMLNKLMAVIDEDRLKISNGKPVIERADYTAYQVFPYV